MVFEDVPARFQLLEEHGSKLSIGYTCEYNNTVSFVYVLDLTWERSNWASSNAKTEVQ